MSLCGKPACLSDVSADRHADAMRRIDGCPNCVRNAETPHTWEPVTNGIRCAYRCTDCGHAWTTDYRSTA